MLEFPRLQPRCDGIPVRPPLTKRTVGRPGCLRTRRRAGLPRAWSYKKALGTTIICSISMLSVIYIFGSVAEFVGKPLEKWRPDGRREDEFFALTVACRGIRKGNTRFEHVPEPGGMQSLQSTDGSVLRLHSCRALSPGPQSKVAQPLPAKKLVFGLFNRLENAIERIQPEDQPCSWKLRLF